MSCKITPRQVGDVIILDCEGRITLGEGSTIFREAIETCIYGKPLVRDACMRPVPGWKSEPRNILLHLGYVHYMDSSGIGELISAYETVTNAGGSLKLLNLTKRTRDILLNTKLYTIFEIFDDERQAVRSFH